MVNQFKPFAIGENANVTSQSDWEALDALSKGFQSGKASSAQVNKALRQATFIASALAQYTANKYGQDVLDDGNLDNFVTLFMQALAVQCLSRNNPFGDIASDGSDAVETALNNLGIKSSAKRDVGSGTNQIPDMSFFASSFSTSGGGAYFYQPNGTLVQYSYAEITGPGPWTLSFPVAFPNECRSIVMTDAGAGAFSPGAQILSKTQFNAYSKAPEGQKVGFYFICIGR